MKPTNVTDPGYYGRVVDCQWACPAHTNVPEYIRLIGQGRYDDAYLLNRETNVFPGILGRTCDRPCEPACRRGRVDSEPVAICRLKRVAADLRGDIRSRLPAVPASKNGRRIAAVGCGPASLTVANDLLPLGYQVTIFERGPQTGGLMRVGIPTFRLPEAVLDQEIGDILAMGADVRFNSPVESLRELLAQGFDAIFLGSGAPRGKELEIPGRHDGDGDGHVLIGLDWLAAIAFGHVRAVGRRVLIIGVGNTAMDCCRSARRLGGEEVTVVARRPRAFFKASAWELADAEEEGVAIEVNLAPRRFVHEDGRLVGVEFNRLEWDERAESCERREAVFLPADDVILAVGQENAFPYLDEDLSMAKDAWGCPVVDPETMMSSLAGVFVGGDAAFGAKNIVTAVAQAHVAARSIDRFCSGRVLEERPTQTVSFSSRKLGLAEWSYANDFNPVGRQQSAYADLARRFSDLGIEAELGLSAAQAAREIERCLNCDIETVFMAERCIECDACLDVCPVQCLTIRENDTEEELRQRLRAPSLDPAAPLFVSAPLRQTGRVMLKDENLCVHCGLCAERCPTAAFDMARFEARIAHLSVTTVATGGGPA